MKADKGVFKRKGSDVWQHRVYVPKDLQAAYGGKDALPAKSLQTRDLVQANRLARVRLAEFEREFAHKRAALGGKRDAVVASASARITADLMERLAAVHATQIVEADFAHRASVFQRAQADPKAFWRGELVPEPDDWKTFGGQPYSYWAYLTEHEDTTLETGVAYVLQMERENRLATLRSAYAAGNVEILHAEARALLAPYDNDEADRLKLLRRLMDVEIATRKAITEEQSTNLPSPPAELGDDQENPLLSAAARAWLEEKKSVTVTGRRVEDCEAAVALFIEITGDKPVASYTKGDVREFKAVMRALPANRTKIRETRGLDARAAAKAAQKHGLEPMAVKTANNKYIATLYNLFEFALGNYDRIDRNPLVNAALPSRSSPREEWNPFTLDALRTFFNAPLYTGCKSARHWLEPGAVIPRDSARFWIPLLLLYSGARQRNLQVAGCRCRQAGGDLLPLDRLGGG